MRIIQSAVFAAILVTGGAFTAPDFHKAGASEAPSLLQDRDPQKPLQGVVASKTAKFETTEKTDPLYKGALDAHELAGALKLVGKDGAFKGTITKLYEERDGDMVVLDFDPNYRTALTAALKNPDFPKFPDVKTLQGKEVVVSGRFVDFHGKAQIELTDPGQIKLVK
jgi:hypothetical protein